jgi:GT2 family glycosyltransferase
MHRDEAGEAIMPLPPCESTAVHLDIGVIYTDERQHMARLLATLPGSALGLRARVILVDNDSVEGVQPWRDCFQPLTILRNTRRLSYAANLNRICEAATAPFVLLLNTDVYFDPAEQCLAKMVAFMNAHPRCGVASCRIIHPDGSEAYAARRFQTLRMIAARRLGLSPLMKSTIDRYLYREFDVRDVFACDWVSGCFLLARRAAWQAVGGFDPGYQKYFEDVDFCARLARSGWQVLYNGRTCAYHVEQRSSKRLFSLDAWRHGKSYLRWLRTSG